MKYTPLYRRPRELGRRAAGQVLEWTLNSLGATAATAVALGNNETLAEKIHDATHVVPDIFSTYRRARYLIEHQEQIQKAMEYARDHAPTPEKLDAIVKKSSAAIEQYKVAKEYLGQAKDDLFNLHPLDAYNHLVQAWNTAPDTNAFQHILSAAEYTSKALSHIKDVDWNPVYQGMLNMADNFSKDEAAATVGVMAAAVGVTYGTGKLVGRLWAQRGMPGMLTRFWQRVGVRCNRNWYKENLEEVMGPELYGIAKEHFEKLIEKND